MATVARPPTTVGRQAILREVHALTDPPRSGAVLLTGGPGVGKSHLARALAADLARQGATVDVIQGGTASAGVPLGPCAHLIPVLTGEVPVAGLIAAALERHRRRARNKPAVVLADDVDRLDDASATLVSHLVGTPGVSVIATARDAGLLPAPLAGLLPARLEVIPVHPLDPGEASELGALVAGGPLDSSSARLLFEATGGNPLWITEMVRVAARERTLTRGRSGLHLDPKAAAGGLEQVLELRLRELSDAERDALSLLAVAGNLKAATLEGLVGPTVTARLGTAGMVEVSDFNGTPIVRLVHPLYRQALLGRLGPLEVRLVLRRLIGAAQASPELRGEGHLDRASLIRLALWHAELGERFDPEALGWAARTVHWGLLDVVRRHLSGEHGSRGSDAGLEAGLQSAADRADASVRLAAAVWKQERTFHAGLGLLATILFSPKHAADMVALLDELAPLAVTDEERATLGVSEAIWLFWVSGDRTGALTELLELQAELDAPWSRVVASTRAGLTFHGGRVADALALLRSNQPPAGARPEETVAHASPYAAALIFSGRVEQGVAEAERALPVACGLGDRWYRSMGELVIAQYWGQLCLGRYSTVRNSTRAVADLLGEADSESRAIFAGMAARSLLSGGKVATAAEELEAAIRSHGPVAMFGLRPLLHSTRAVALAWSGRTDEAAAEAREARRWNIAPRFFDAELDLTDAVVLAAQGRRSRAVRTARDAAGRAAGEGNAYYAFTAAYLTARLQPSTESLHELDEAAARVDLPLAAFASAHGEALVAGGVSELEAAASEASRLGEELLALEILEVAVELARSDGSRIGRLRLESALRAQRALCEQARSPITQLPVEPSGLTSREAEIAALASTGWTSAAIAEELVLSVRTVESHLYRIYAKLGVRSREDLTGALRGRPRRD